mmetsp:Transcript_34141/g.75119  ORF Transcript_34141/g.75119 Transcript_34141/m.75119 type:complete len:314 (+) Transcript_34141:248-1189(+)
MENTVHKTDSPLPTANAFTAIVSTVIYLYMFVIFLCYWGFLLPSTILPIAPYKFETSRVADDTGTGILIDVALLLAFIIPHSILARTEVKAMMNLSPALERPFFVLQTTIFMHLQMQFWQEFDAPLIWNVQEPYSWAILALFLFGFLFLFTATFALDHFWLFGLSQGYGIDFNKAFGLAATDDADGFVVRWHYALCAHPIMTGMMIGLFATPTMTASHLLFSVVNTAWMVGAIKHLEEPQLTDLIGERYSEYLATVPRYVPSGSRCPFTGGNASGGCSFSSRPHRTDAIPLASNGSGGGYGTVKKYESPVLLE